ncbi:MAG: OmpA family protein [Candidatus Bathyarchaeia archaeon]
MSVKIENIFWWMMGMLIPVLMSVSTVSAALWVNYEENTYRSDMVTWATDYMFVISQTDRVSLSPFRETAQTTTVQPGGIKKPLISIMVSKVDDTVQKPPQVEQKQKEQPVVQEKKTYTVYFNFDSYRLRRDQIPVLDSIPKGGDVADIYGYTCRIGPDSYNKRLSQKRARVVADYLQRRGVAVGKVIGMGKTNEERILRLNRKAVIQLH